MVCALHSREPMPITLPRHALVAALLLASAAGCGDDDEQFIVSGSLVAHGDAIVGNARVLVSHHRVDANISDNFELRANTDGVFGWPAPIEHAGDDVFYSVNIVAGDLELRAEFQIPADAADAGGFTLPPLPVWAVDPELANANDGALLAWNAAPADVPVIDYDVEVLGFRPSSGALLWRDTVVDANQLALTDELLEDFRIEASVAIDVEPPAPLTLFQATSARAGRTADEDATAPVTRGGTCGDDELTCAFADGDLELVFVEDADIIVELPAPAELDTIVVRSLTTSPNTEVAVEVAPFGRAFLPFATTTAGLDGSFLALHADERQTVAAIRIRATGDAPDIFGLAEVSGF